MNLEGKIALVTGAATGIGEALAKELVRAGARVMGADIVWKRGENLPRVHQFECDVADPASVDRCVSKIEEHYGGVDILINNAAVATELSPGPFEQIDPQEWMRVLSINTLGPFLCSKAVLPHMRKKKWGRIINLSSGMAFAGTPYMLHYVASKGAIVAMTRSLASEVGRDGITVNAIAPGLTLTDGIERNEGFSEELKAGVIASRAIPREERAEDVVGTGMFLASDAASFVTGQIVVVDGGATFH